MSNLFSNQGISEEVKTGNNQQYIYGGIYHNVIIADVTKGVFKNGTESLRLKMHTKEGGEQAVKEFDFYFSEAAVKMSKTKLKHIATKVTKAANFDNMPANSLDEYIQNYAKLVKGKELRMKFIAEQYLNSNGEVKDAAKIGLPEFAEATQTGAEYAPVADEDTKLVYDKNNEYDYKKLAIQADTETETTSDDASWLDN